MARVPAAVDGYRAGLLHAAANGNVAAVRQVTKVAEQCEVWAGRNGKASFFADFVAGARDVPDSVRADLDAARAARGRVLRRAGRVPARPNCCPRRPAKDAVGEDVYRLWSREYLGAALDLREAYEWGWAEFTRIETEMKEVAEPDQAGRDASPRPPPRSTPTRATRCTGRRRSSEWMQKLSDQALADLRGVHFDIPDRDHAAGLQDRPARRRRPARTTRARPTTSAAPGAMWWSLPPDKEEFSTWREVSIVYHEGVPGHHLQIATAIHESERLNRFQRHAVLGAGVLRGLGAVRGAADAGVRLPLRRRRPVRHARTRTCSAPPG